MSLFSMKFLRFLLIFCLHSVSLHCLKTITVPGTVQNVVLGENSTNVKLTWTIDLEGDPLNQLKVSRHMYVENDLVKSSTPIGVMYSSNAIAVYSPKYSLNASSLFSSAYVILTINNVLNQSKNTDGSEVDVLKNAYGFKIEVDVQNHLIPTLVDTVKIQVFVLPTIIVLVCQGCVNGNAMENQTITLLCNVTGKPIPNIRWMKNGVHYNGSSSVSSPMNKLVFQHVAINDKGNYTCIADNGIGNPDRKSLTLLVKYKPTNTLLSPTKLDVCENTNITLSCTADAYPSVQNYSLYNGNTYIGSNSNGQFTTTAGSLAWNKFCCIASNVIGSGQCAFSDAYVLGDITTLCKINDENTSVAAVKEGDKVVLQCDVSGNESYYIYQWIKVKDSLSVRNDTRQLTFGSINRMDEGYYQVTLRDKLNCSSQTKSFNITVNYKPENTGIKITPDKKDFGKGESINISCTSDAKPAPVYSLYRNNVFNGSNGNGLFFVNLAENGNYTFTCVSNNAVGVGPNKNKSVSVRGPLIKTCKIGNEIITHKTVVEGSEIVLRMISSEMERLGFTWKNNTVNILGEVGHSLTIQPISRYQGGMYQVVARDRFNCSADMICDFSLNVQHKPENTVIKITPDKKDFCKGESVNISCTSDAKPAPVYSLYRNNVFNGSNGDGVFVVKLAENGNYTFTCVSSNTVGVGPNKSKSVTVRGPLIVTCKVGNEIITHKTVVEGSEIVLRLMSSDVERLGFTWKKNTVNVVGEVGHSLTIQPITRYQGGMYQVVARDRFNCSVDMTCDFTLNVQLRTTAPEITNPYKQELAVVEDQDVSFVCNASGYPVPNITWTKDGIVIGVGRIFNITRVKRNDSSCYTCTADNGIGHAKNTSICLDVQYPPSSITILPSRRQMILKEGASLSLYCQSDSNPSATYMWKHNEETLTDGQNGILIFNNIKRKQNGTYLCKANNYLGFLLSVPIEIVVQYLDPLEVIGSSNKSYSQSNPLVLFNLSINAYPSNTSLSCNPSAPNILTTITSHDAELTRKQYLVFVVIQNEVDFARIVCKAENGLGVRDRTLHFYRRPILFKETFTGQFRITNQEWQDGLRDVKSAGYDDLKQKCIKTLEAAYSGVPYLAAVNIKDFIKGSIIVRFELEVIGKVPDPLLPLRNYTKRQGEVINGLQIDSIQKSSDFKENTQIPTDKNNKTLVAVLGVLFGLSIVLNIIFIVGFLWLRRKDSKGISGKKSNTSDERGQMNDISLQETSFNGKDNETPNVPEYEPIGRRGLSTSNVGIPEYEPIGKRGLTTSNVGIPEYEPIGNRGLSTSNVGIPEYEAVTTRTRPRQPHSGVQTNNSMPQYESTDQHGQTEAVSKPPPVTYQTIQPRTGNYDSLSSFTRLHPQGTVLPSKESPTRTGEYQALQHKGVSPQYQSLEDLSKC